MKIVLIFCIFIYSSLYGGNKIKSKVFADNIMYTKLLANSYSTTPKRAEFLGVNEYLKSIKLFANDKLLVDIETSYYLTTNPIFKFAIKGADGSKIKAEIIDNHNKIATISNKIRYVSASFEFKNIYPKKTKRKPWVDIEDIDESEVKKRYKNTKFIKGDMDIYAPDVASNGGAVPIEIRPNIKVKSVTLFTTNKKNQMKFVCKWTSNSKYKILSYFIKFKLAEAGYARVVLEAENGKFYSATRFIAISLGGGDQ